MEPVNPTHIAFEREMLPHMPALHNFALKLSRDSEDANDLVQETYLRAYRYFDKFIQGTNAIAWLYRIMKNSYINRYRKSSKEPAKLRYDNVTESYPNTKTSITETDDLQEKMLGNHFEDEVAKALQCLQENFRTVIILSDIEEYTYKEIADFVQIPVGTVRSRLHRGRKTLRSALWDYGIKHGFRDVVGSLTDLHTPPRR